MKTKIEHSSATNPNPVLSVAKDGTVLYSNKADDPLLHEWGVEVGEKLPSSIGDIVQRVIFQNSPEKMEVKVGKRVYLVVFHPLPEQECVNISGFDISDQKELEGKLRESENKYRNIVETSIEGIWIFNSVSETTYVNEKMAEMLGYKSEEMIGRFIWDFAYEEDKDIFQIKLANRKQGTDEVYELKLIRKDGSSLWASVSAKGFFDGAGKFEGSVGMFTDITDRKRAEEALRESKARVESIFRSSPVGIGVVVDRMIKEANERLCEMTGYSREELLGKSALMLYPTAEEYERAGLVKYGMITERDTGYVETHWQRKDSSVVDILLSSSPIIPGDLSGEITFTALDVTERKHAEEALKKAHDTLEEKVKERTAELEKAYNSLKESEKSLANIQIVRQKEIHHRIKNNLQVISSLLDLQSEKFRNRECVEEAEVLKAFRESQDRVMSIALIHEELHEGRGTDTLNFSLYLKRLVNNLFQTYKLGNVNTCLNIELKEDIFFDMDIAVPLGIIINELVSNSLKYAFAGRDKGLIQIKLFGEECANKGQRSKKDGYNGTNFTLTVLDNGIGIPEDFNSEDSGSLGLQLVAILVDQLGGELELNRNNGTEFTIRFTITEKNEQIEPNKN
ncbi:MAG: PAS domain-containing sensor histidine kinase [Methanosarcina sp.]|nr:hypothetical protein BGV40_09255 [Methanosarcina sp. Ant1]